MKHDAVTGKMLLKGRLDLKSPLIIGSGKNSDGIDITVVKDQEGKPYIPATSMTGVLRHFFFERLTFPQKWCRQVDYFWGRESKNKEENCQSAMIMHDLKTKDQALIKVRDGLKIDNSIGTAVSGCKYDYEVVEPVIGFDLEMEITLRAAYKTEVFCEILAALVNALEKEEISLGAMTTKGFGRCRLETYQCCFFNFEKKEHVLAWLNREFPGGEEQDFKVQGRITKEDKEFSIKADFFIKNSLIVRSYSGSPKDPDAVHITSQDKYVLPGTTVKGAVRNRAVRIINVLGGKGEEISRQFFGWVDDGKEQDIKRKTNQEKIKSRVIFYETEIFNTCSEVQNRIKIDRFTGGTINGALFNTMPLWPFGEQKRMISIEMKVPQYAGWEAGLLLLILKDLWTGDLPVGGEKSVGRGVLKGLRATIIAGEMEVEIKQAADGKIICPTDARDVFEKYVQALYDKCRSEEVTNG